MQWRYLIDNKIVFCSDSLIIDALLMKIFVFYAVYYTKNSVLIVKKKIKSDIWFPVNEKLIISTVINSSNNF